MLRIIILAGIGFFFFIFHGLSSHLNPWSQALINAAVKYTYGKTGQDQVTVVLFREENLAQLQTHYPVPYRVHTQVIETLATYEPAAVFVDFAFIDNRDEQSIGELGEALCLLEKSMQTPGRVFIAAPVSDGIPNAHHGTPTEKTQDIPSQLLKCAKPAMPEMDGKTAESGVLTYFHGRGEGKNFVPSPAFALAETEIGLDPVNGKKLEIIWGKGVAPLNEKWMNCAEKPAIDVLRDTLNDNPLSNRLDCPYHRTISANHLLNSVGDPDIATAISGKTIFYGGGFRFTGDRVESPVYGELPGVYLHAMAYDNLVTFGRDDFKHANREGMLAKFLDLTLLLIAAALLVCAPQERKADSQTYIDFLQHSRIAVIAAALALLAMSVVLTKGGVDIACLVGALLYVVYRWLIQHDWAFFFLAMLTVMTSLICYYGLDLGPRNILAFVAFYEVVGHFQEKLVRKAKEYEEIRTYFLNQQTNGEEGADVPMPSWDRLLNWFFMHFHSTDHPSQERSK